jgi:regulation of enolase protein 1 (concanavalin A-like superfamily)
MRKIEFKSGNMPVDFFWFNQPAAFEISNGLSISTKEKTDFWQGTHYGFRKDDGHCLLTDIGTDFCIETKIESKPTTRYDQCGLFVRIDQDNWIKCSLEYENREYSRLGSVVTNFSYSDWATQDVPSSNQTRWYRIDRRGKDFLLRHSADGNSWEQMRITHLHNCAGSVSAGIYACSPIGGGFVCKIFYIHISNTEW